MLAGLSGIVCSVLGVDKDEDKDRGLSMGCSLCGMCESTVGGWLWPRLRVAVTRGKVEGMNVDMDSSVYADVSEGGRWY